MKNREFLHIHLRPSIIVLAIFLAFSLFFAFFYGPIGYAGDTWNYVYTALYQTDFHSLTPEAQDYWMFQRPVEYLIQIYALLKVGGLAYSPRAIHLLSLIFLSLNAFLFTKFLENIYGNESRFVMLTSILAFFYGPFFALTFRLNTSAILSSGVFFWGMSLLFLKLIYTPSVLKKVVLGVLTFSCYTLSVFNYENFVLVILVLPVFVYVKEKNSTQPNRSGNNWRILRHSVFASVGVFIGVVGLKYFLPHAIRHTPSFSFSRTLHGLWVYASSAILYEFDAFREVFATPYRYLALLVFGLLWLLNKGQRRPHAKSDLTPFLLGGIIFLFGSIPYILAGYDIGGTFPNYTGGARVISSASFGMLLALSGTIRLKRHTIFSALVMLLLSCNIAFTFILGDAWKEATLRQKSLFTSLLKVCPDVEDNTHFIFLDAQSYVGTKAAIWDGVYSTHFLPQIIYDNPTLRGGLAYSGEVINREGTTTVVTKDGIRPRTYGDIFPLDRVVIVKNIRDTFEIVDIQKTDPLNVLWEASHFELNKTVLQKLRDEGMPENTVRALKPLKQQQFFDDQQFLESIEKRIGTEYTDAYQKTIKEFSWNDVAHSISTVKTNSELIRAGRIENAFTKYLEALPD